jgi:hypothetical protein
LNIREYQHKSKIKEKLAPSLNELIAQGYLKNWEVEKTADGKDFKIVFGHGHKFYADQTILKQLSGRKAKRSENSPVETRKIENRTEIPETEKEAAKQENFAAETISDGQPDAVLTETLPDAVTAEQRELASRLNLEYMISFEKAYELATKRQAETIRQLEAFPFREIAPKNRAGFLIEAIEQSYSLPDAYFEYIKNREVIEERKAKQADIDTCPLCDEKGWRNVKSEQDTFYGMMHQCTHDPKIESQFEDHKA